MKTIVVALLLNFAFPFVVESQAGTFEVLNHNSLVRQGGVLVVRISDDLKSEDLQLFAFDELHPFNNNGLAFVGIGVDHKPDRYIVYLVETSAEKHLQHDFFYTHVEVLEQGFGTPWYAGPAGVMSPAVQAQRKAENDIKDQAYSSANLEEDYTRGPFVMPLEEVEVTDGFGTPRLYGPRNRRTKTIKIERQVPHVGTDLRARTPLPVLAVNSGKVMLARNFPLRGTEGNMLIIDHGSGILSLYLHLSRFRVKIGETVERGQVIALTGRTPRGTPPHLHFMIKVHGVNVDPLEFIKTTNSIFPFGISE